VNLTLPYLRVPYPTPSPRSNSHLTPRVPRRNLIVPQPALHSKLCPVVERFRITPHVFGSYALSEQESYDLRHHDKRALAVAKWTPYLSTSTDLEPGRGGVGLLVTPDYTPVPSA
jgi:hypothetical protein